MRLHRLLQKVLAGTFLAVCVTVLARDNSHNAKPVVLQPDKDQRAKVYLWLESSLQRVYPQSPVGMNCLGKLLAARNGQISFQACVKNARSAPFAVECAVSGGDGLDIRIRREGFVPLRHHTDGTPASELDGIKYTPGYVPDPLYHTQKANVGPFENMAFWITVKVPEKISPGRRELKVNFTYNGTNHAELPVSLEISSFVIQPRHDFPVIHWWRGEATWDYYKTEMFDDRWWQITRWQLEDMLAHGSDVVFVPIFFERRETFQRPCQLLIVNEPQPGKYEFDFSRVKRFLEMSKEIGFRQFEWQHFWIYWGVEHPMRIYKKVGDKYVMLWSPDISGFSETYLNFLKQFLPQFHDFLVQQGVLDHSYFHLSDEPGGGEHIVRYRKARQILREMAPWMQGKVMDALSHIEYGREGITDIPIPMVNSAQNYINEKIPHWVYYCCSPKGMWLNRFYDTPLAKVRMSGFLFYRLGAKGFLHWGFNYWHKMEKEEINDPYHDGSNGDWPGIPFGDPFVIYPGEDGKPLDSIRWEVFAESLQDYAILQTAGVKPDDALLAEVKSYAVFPKNEEWIEKTLAQILQKSANVGSQ